MEKTTNGERVLFAVVGALAAVLTTILLSAALLDGHAPNPALALPVVSGGAALGWWQAPKIVAWLLKS